MRHGWFRASEFLDRDVLEISNEGVEKGSFASSDLSDDAQELALFDAEHDVFESDVFRDHDGVGDNAVLEGFFHHHGQVSVAGFALFFLF